MKNGKGIYIFDNNNRREERYYEDDRRMLKKENLVYNDCSIKNETPIGIVISDEKDEKNFSGKKLRIYEDGTYEGNFEKGLKSGIGVYNYKNGDKYIGDI